MRWDSQTLPSDAVYRPGVGWVAKSISKTKARDPKLRHAMRGPVDARADLRMRVQLVPGLEKHAPKVAAAFKSWRDLGEIGQAKYLELLGTLPVKRLEFADLDLRDPTRLGPGHLNSIDMLRLRARREAEQQCDARVRAIHEWKALLRFKRPIADSRSWTRVLTPA